MSPRKSSTSSANALSRPRYLAVEVAGDQPVPLRRFEQELLQRLGGASSAGPLKVIRYDGSRALVRISHRAVPGARVAWNAPPGPLGLPIRTLRSYGTLRKGKIWMRGRGGPAARDIGDDG